jgi:hypothetical protein
MKVKLAAQVLSNSCSAALDCCVAEQEIESAAVATSTYCKEFNDLFHLLNSSSPQDRVPFRRPSSTDSDLTNFLEESLHWLKELDQLNKKRHCSFIMGWIHSINVILKLREISDEKHLPYLSTRNLCQDPLELFFGKIRLIQKFPDALSFINCYAKTSTASLLLLHPRQIAKCFLMKI